MESFITFLVIIVVAIVSTWIKNRAARTDDQSNPSANPPDRRPPPRMTSWEEEMRRLLEGEAGTPPPRPRPPPVVIAQPPPLVAPKPPLVPTAAPVIRPVIVPRTARPAIELPPSATMSPKPAEAAVVRKAGLSESKLAYERASQIDKTVSQHIDRVPGQRVLATVVQRRPPPPEIAQGRSLFKNAQSARQAVIASIILGPPKSLDESSALA